MELVFFFTGWEFAKEGKKATDFASLCTARGVAFNLADSKDRALEIQETDSRIQDFSKQIEEVLQPRKLNRHETLKLRQLPPRQVGGACAQKSGGSRIHTLQTTWLTMSLLVF